MFVLQKSDINLRGRKQRKEKKKFFSSRDRGNAELQVRSKNVKLKITALSGNWVYILWCVLSRSILRACHHDINKSALPYKDKLCCGKYLLIKGWTPVLWLIFECDSFYQGLPSKWLKEEVFFCSLIRYLSCLLLVLDNNSKSQN